MTLFWGYGTGLSKPADLLSAVLGPEHTYGTIKMLLLAILMIYLFIWGTVIQHTMGHVIHFVTFLSSRLWSIRLKLIMCLINSFKLCENACSC